MIFLLVLVVVVVWVMTVRDEVRRRDLRTGRRAIWILATLLPPSSPLPSIG